jgi:phospholipid transport system substrate-binding protein
MMRRFFPVCALALVIATLTAAPRAIAAPDAVAFINEIGVRTIQVLGPTATPAQRLVRFRELLRDDFDVPGISQFVLGRYWRTATPQQQQEFLRLFVEYVAQAYSARLAEYAGEPFHAVSARPNGDQTVVISEIIQPSGKRVQVDWYLIDRAGALKISDVYVSGVSMKVTQRDEFASVIQQGGGQIEFLLGKLRQKNAGNP